MASMRVRSLDVAAPHEPERGCVVLDTAALPRRKTTPILAGVRAGLLLLLSFCLSAVAAPQTAWIARHNFDQPANSNQVVAMTLDNSGNIILAGTSANANGDFDYSILKYSPTGAQQWAVTYNSGPLADDQLRAMTVDSNGNVYVTGTSKTVKYNSSGSLQWDAPYGGRALAVDSNEFLYVVGFQEQDFATVKLAPQGTNMWLRTYDHAGLQDIAQAVTFGPSGEVYVGGTFTWHCDRVGCYVVLGLLQYDVDGNRLWVRSDVFSCSLNHPSSELRGAVVLDRDRIYLSGSFSRCGGDYLMTQVDSSGSNQWTFALGSSGEGMTSMALRPSGETYLTGRSWNGFPYRLFYRTVALTTNGALRWKADFDTVTQSHHRANSLALDGSGGVYVTGQSSASYLQPSFDFLTIKYDNDGHEKWTQRYNGPANGSDIATGIAVAADGAIYVAGHSANANGGTDITLIKYVELQTIQVQTDQSVLLQFLGTPGQSYRFLATTNLANWDELGAAIADPLGLYQWLDTNQPLAPHKFYRTVSP